MKSLLAGLTVAGLVGGGGLLFLHKGSIHLPSFSSQIPSIQVPSGKVLGISQSVQNPAVGNAANQVGGVIGSIANSVGIGTVNGGEQIVANLTSTPNGSGGSIDVSQVVANVQNQLNSLPGNLVHQAQIQYCQQVLQNATASGVGK
ncbi:hypothetical protein C5B42_01010 [Candidatus Cerribacteria bacterium 'Amazon FNV 2010 28 9']|uniref:Uncharacterized protein n=1 Tax=Candidatus Cerribacteria bacterium 'Amazon FNV 2010 28 9' TaxID=2081795 RepID=A0A317JR94_9BACT|nr:MAG: hypothetical protein C5B42_01010 [Candidatus Cerribacteria bacterium 'Amazon FNV 2010 28 9']